MGVYVPPSRLSPEAGPIGRPKRSLSTDAPLQTKGRRAVSRSDLNLPAPLWGLGVLNQAPKGLRTKAVSIIRTKAGSFSVFLSLRCHRGALRRGAPEL